MFTQTLNGLLCFNIIHILNYIQVCKNFIRGKIHDKRNIKRNTCKIINKSRRESFDCLLSLITTEFYSLKFPIVSLVISWYKIYNPHRNFTEVPSKLIAKLQIYYLSSIYANNKIFIVVSATYFHIITNQRIVRSKTIIKLTKEILSTTHHKIVTTLSNRMLIYRDEISINNLYVRM